MPHRSWGPHCPTDKLVQTSVGGVQVTVHRWSLNAWFALDQLLWKHHYPVRPQDTGAYNCRRKKTPGGKLGFWSNHAWGLAIDINWTTNPYIWTPSMRKIRWDIDTDLPQPMVEDIEALRTRSGERVFGWGGRWRTVKDPMHFEIIASRGGVLSGVDVSMWKPPPSPELIGDTIEDYEFTRPEAIDVANYQGGVNVKKAMEEIADWEAAGFDGYLLLLAMHLDQKKKEKQ